MYQEFQPCDRLAPFVDKYWELKGTPGYGVRLKILPDGCSDYIFSLGDVAQPVSGELIMQPYRSYFVGPMRIYTELVTHTECIHQMGVRFTPYGLAALSRTPLHEFTDLRISTDAMDSLFDCYFTERLCETGTLAERLGLIENYLLASLYKYTEIDPQIVLSTQLIQKHNGQLPIQKLLDKLCIGQRHLERKFKQTTGFTPKEFSRITKFRYAIDVLRHSSSDDQNAIAIHCGYYDQSHFIREFRKLSGDLPSSFIMLERPDDDPITYTK